MQYQNNTRYCEHRCCIFLSSFSTLFIGKTKYDCYWKRTSSISIIINLLRPLNHLIVKSITKVSQSAAENRTHIYISSISAAYSRDSFPNTPIIIIHCSNPVEVGYISSRRTSAFRAQQTTTGVLFFHPPSPSFLAGAVEEVGIPR